MISARVRNPIRITSRSNFTTITIRARKQISDAVGAVSNTVTQAVVGLALNISGVDSSILLRRSQDRLTISFEPRPTEGAIASTMLVSSKQSSIPRIHERAQSQQYPLLSKSTLDY